MHNIKINLNGLETMVFFWNSIISKEKVNEAFINNVCSMKEFSYVYDEDFTSESLRTILSALTNKEPYRGNKKEMKYYSNNLRVMEYIDQVEPTISSIKKLNLDALSNKVDSDKEIVIITGTTNSVTKSDNTIIVDFFSIRYTENGLFIGEKTIEDSIIEA